MSDTQVAGWRRLMRRVRVRFVPAAVLGAVLVVLAACASFDAVSFVDGNTGWTGGDHVILKTSDGGQTWERQYDGTAHIIDLEFVDDLHGWAVGEEALLVTSDGGATWTETGEPAQPLLKVDFVNENVGFGVASSSPDVPGSLVRTDDGGATWQTISTPNPLGDVCFQSAHDGWVGVITPPGPTDLIPGLAVLHTTNGGTSWTQVLAVAPDDLLSAGGPTPLGTPVAAQLRCEPNAVWFLALGLAAHQEVRTYRVYRMNNAGVWTLRLAQPAPAGINEGPTMGPRTFDAVSGATAFVGGVCGACESPVFIVKTTTAGSSWTQISVPDALTPFTNFHLSFATAATGWLATNPGDGKPGEIYRTTDGGATWVKQYPQ